MAAKLRNRFPKLPTLTAPRRTPVRNRRLAPRLLSLVALALVAFSLLLLPDAAPIEAAPTEVELVSNTNQALTGFQNTPFERAHAFHTGPAANAASGYVLESVTIQMGNSGAGNRSTTVNIRTNRTNLSNDGIVATLTGTLASGYVTWSAPANTILNANTTYWVILNDGTASNGARYAVTSHVLNPAVMAGRLPTQATYGILGIPKPVIGSRLVPA